MDEPWTLEVYGFDGKRYNIALKPGEMALYEGHALIHGRPKNFEGQKYSNAFCHFKPKNKWDWRKATFFDLPQTISLIQNKLSLNHADDIYI